MARDARDSARLRRIEIELEQADPQLVQTFRRWQPHGGSFASRGWSAVPLWMVFVFVIAFATWTLTPVVGVLAASVGLLCWLRTRLLRRGTVTSGPPRR